MLLTKKLLSAFTENPVKVAGVKFQTCHRVERIKMQIVVNIILIGMEDK